MVQPWTGTDIRKTLPGRSSLKFKFPYIANNTAGPSGRDLPVLLIDFDSRDAVLEKSSEVGMMVMECGAHSAQ